MPRAQLSPGEVFASDFRVVKPLSEGGMGAVYVVEQISTGKRRALKLMLPALVADFKLRRRFEQEARIGGSIDSEHVVEVVGAGVEERSATPWLAMELLQGEDLAERVRRLGPLPLEELRTIFMQLGHAIGAAHAAGIVHRDLKPENIFLATSRRAEVQTTVKVLDFGIAKIAAEAQTTDTAAVGSPMWMAPEQTARGGAIGPPTDVWALGLIAFHLLTGRFFWRSADGGGGTLAHLIREIVLDPIPPSSTRAQELGCPYALPPGFDEWFARCLDRDPRRRFANARDALAAFPGAFSGPRTQAPVPHGVAPPTQHHAPLPAAPTVTDARMPPRPGSAPTWYQAPAEPRGGGGALLPAQAPQAATEVLALPRHTISGGVVLALVSAVVFALLATAFLFLR